ncbi:MAG TPA: hypothetical protein VGI45_28430 [Terracidiphilus sp.]|jgi:hypothetical protein
MRSLSLLTILRLSILLLTTIGLASAQKPAETVLPDAPTPVEPAGPERVAPITTTETKQMRPSFATSLTAREKYALAYRRIVSPQMPIKAVFVSGFELAAHTGPDFATNGWGPFGERVGYNALGISTTTFFNTAFVPALVHQDPRFFPLGEGPVKTRVMWAVRSEFVGFGDDGHAMPNYANLVGFGLSSILANAYTPRGSRGYEDTIKRYVIKIGVSAGMNVGREFGVFHRVKALAHHSKSADE